jgi:flagellar motor switch protein FliN/FliY
MAEDTTAPASPIDVLSPAQTNDAESRSPRNAADTERLLREAEAALQDVEVTLQGPKPAPFKLEELIGQGGPPEKCTMDLLRDVELDLKIELGRTEMFLEDILKLRRGSVVTLDKLAGDPVDIYVNGRLVARGEVLVLNDNFCVRVAELVGSDALAADK